MTVSEYLNNALRPFGQSDNELADIYLSASFAADDEYGADNADDVGIALTHALPALILRPRLGSVSESGFSVSYDYAQLSHYYLYLCRKYGIKPDATVLETTGMNVITDKTDIW